MRIYYRSPQLCLEKRKLQEDHSTPLFRYRNLSVADPVSADAPEALPGAQHADNV